MHNRRPRRVNLFFTIVLAIVILMLVYVNRFFLPTQQLPFIPSPTPTRVPEAYVSEAENLFAAGKLSQAMDAYWEAIRIKPNDPSFYIALARIQIFAGEYEKAVVNSGNALLLSSNNSMARAVRGWAQTKLGQYTQADESLQSALKIDPNNGLAHAYYAFLLGEMAINEVGPYLDPIQMAIEESKVAVSLAPNSLEAHWARAYILYITGNPELAIQEYLAAININPNISEIHLELGLTYRALEVIDKALQEYTVANTLNPADYRPDLYSSRALAYTGEWAKAVQYAETAVRDAPTDPYLHGNLGYMLYKNFEWPAALEELALAVNGGSTADGEIIYPLPPGGNETWSGDDPWIARYYSYYAILLARTEKCVEALPLTQVILDAFRTNDDAVYNARYAQDLCAGK